MTYGENLWLFFLVVSGIIIVPGMDMFFVLASSLSGGRWAGLSATFGIMAGVLVHTLYAALGVGVLLHFAPQLFNVLLVLGAAYVAWIGWQLFRSSIVVDALETLDSRGLVTRFRQGALTSLMNPKAYLFMLAVFPQFLRPEFGPVWRQALVMLLLIWITQLAVYGGLALAAARSRDALVGSPAATRFIGRAAGVLLVAIAVFTLWRGWGGV
jgi:threonine/homoserine/homoserine lactone efflux protein